MDKKAGWRKIEELFNETINLPNERQEKFLKSACQGDTDLYREVQSLIKSAKAVKDSDDFLESTGSEWLASIMGDSLQTSWIGRVVGNYRIMRELSSGGMGLVFLAERSDEQFQREVAVKIIKAHLDNSELHLRFLSERQILAHLEHPSIARLIDGGVTEEGLPYLIMEYIDGEPVTDYCDVHQLTIEERLGLFRKICSAVQYAHQNLIVHRDLKPGNILVNESGEPKLLDFGIAKLLNAEAGQSAPALTWTGERLFTPEFASPEQTRGQPVTTASDVYSLGVLLYILLTGHYPYQHQENSMHETEHIIQEEEPRRPSKVIQLTESYAFGQQPEMISPEGIAKRRRTKPELLRRQISGDLSNIVLKSLRKNPTERYASVEQFSEDIRRYLDGLPVEARKPSFAYTSGKFIRRHKIGVIAAALILLSLLVGISATLWQNHIARYQRDLAVRTANTMIFELAEGLSHMSGPTESRLKLLEKAADVFKEINQTVPLSAELERKSIEANRILSQTYRLLGNNRQSLDYAQTAVRRCESFIKNKKPVPEDSILFASVMVEFGDALNGNGRKSEAKKAYANAIQICEELKGRAGAFPEAQRWLYSALIRQGDRLFYQSNLDSAAIYYQMAHEASKDLIEHPNSEPEFFSHYATGLERLGDVFYYSGQISQSCKKYREALQVRQDLVNKYPDNVPFLRAVSIAMQNVGWCEEQAENFVEAIRLYQESTAIQNRLQINDPSNARLTTAVMGGLGTLANALQQVKNISDALAEYDEAIKIGQDYMARGFFDAMVVKKTADIIRLKADLLLAENHPGNALSALHLAKNMFNELCEREPENTDYLRSLANCLTTEADILVARGAFEKGLNLYQEVQNLRENICQITGTSHDRQLEAYSYYKQGKCYARLSNQKASINAYLKGKSILLDLRQSGHLSDDSEGFRIFLPQIEEELSAIQR